MKRAFLLLAAALVLAGCAPKPYWTLTDDKNRQVSSKSFEFSLADGWVRTTEARTWDRLEIDGKQQTILLESMSVTRDGTNLHAITVTRRYADTAFPTLKRKSMPNMLAPEAADLYVAELRKRTGLERLQVLSNKPARVGGKQGFQLLMQFKNDDGLRVEILTYGFVDKTGFYTITYRAPALYYYDRDVKVFNGVVNSFRQTPGAQEPPPEIPGWAKLFT